MAAVFYKRRQQHEKETQEEIITWNKASFGPKLKPRFWFSILKADKILELSVGKS
jgi:hypothetical protein